MLVGDRAARQHLGDRVPSVRRSDTDTGDDGPRGTGSEVSACGGILKTATVSFGQRLDPDVLDAAIEAARTADLLVAIGTTLTVMPGCRAGGHG